MFGENSGLDEGVARRIRRADGGKPFFQVQVLGLKSRDDELIDRVAKKTTAFCSRERG